MTEARSQELNPKLLHCGRPTTAEDIIDHIQGVPYPETRVSNGTRTPS